MYVVLFGSKIRRTSFLFTNLQNSVVRDVRQGQRDPRRKPEVGKQTLSLNEIQAIALSRREVKRKQKNEM
jgi:hypothetical protein